MLEALSGSQDSVQTLSYMGYVTSTANNLEEFADVSKLINSLQT